MSKTKYIDRPISLEEKVRLWNQGYVVIERFDNSLAPAEPIPNLRTMTHELLPAVAQEMLRHAANTPNTAVDPLARVKAIEEATERVKNLYPKLFK